MTDWLEQLNYEPLPALLSSNNPVIQYFVHRDLLEEPVNPIQKIWQLPRVQKITKKQLPNGSWKSANKNQNKYPVINYNLIETWKQLRFLIDQYEMNKTVLSVEKAAEYVFSCQTKEGDIRGILGNQYAAYYSGVLIALLIKAGYATDQRINKGLKWLLSVRQSDGGWLANSLMSLDISWEETTRLTSQDVETIPYQNFSKPSSHNWTGMVIRAFVIHPDHKRAPTTIQAAELLKTRFFQKDPHYTSYQDADYWVKFQFPFWWNDLVAALDSLSLIGFSATDKDIRKALEWLITNQQKDGLWKLAYCEKKQVKYNEKMREMQLWVTLAICRIFKRFF